MAIPPIAPPPRVPLRTRLFGSARLISLFALCALLALCLVFSWTTRGAMSNLSFLGRNGAAAGNKALVDISPWQTAQALAPLAVTAEETAYARDAERLADHEVDQAFASALRTASLQAEHHALSGEALALSQKITQLKQLIQQDQAEIASLTPKTGSASGPSNAGGQPAAGDDDLEVAKAQLGLDTDELADAKKDFDRASGDLSVQIQAELTAHEASMKQFDSASQGDGQVAVLSARKNGTLASRLIAWFSQNNRYQSVQHALRQTQDDAHTLIAEHSALEAKANANAATAAASTLDHAARLSNLKDRSAERQILSIYDDRIQTEQQLASVYSKWAAQVRLQHRILFHLILQSVSLILFIAICMVLFDAAVRRLMSHPALDRRQTQTLRSILEVGIQVLGGVIILLVIFGTPQQTPTILGLATAALTIALQDFILAFLGWFVLVGKNGLHVGDWVEINGVGGEVTEVGLFSTTMLETGTLAAMGHPTGRRITFMNGFAIRGQYFNFSTTGQWMWDEISVSLPASADTNTTVELIHKAVLQQTEANARLAEQEWKRGARGNGLNRFSATPMVNLRPSGSGIDLQVRYVTRASERFELRNRLYDQLVGLLRQQSEPPQPQGTQAAVNS